MPGGAGPGGAMSPLTPGNSSLLPQLSPSPTSSPDPEPSEFLLPAQRSYLKKPSTAAARIYQTLPSRAISPSKTQPRAAFGPNLPPGGWHGTGTTPVPTGSPAAPRPDRPAPLAASRKCRQAPLPRHRGRESPCASRDSCATARAWLATSTAFSATRPTTPLSSLHWSTLSWTRRSMVKIAVRAMP